MFLILFLLCELALLEINFYQIKSMIGTWSVKLLSSCSSPSVAMLVYLCSRAMLIVSQSLASLSAVYVSPISLITGQLIDNHCFNTLGTTLQTESSWFHLLLSKFASLHHLVILLLLALYWLSLSD